MSESLFLEFARVQDTASSTVGRLMSEQSWISTAHTGRNKNHSCRY